MKKKSLIKIVFFILTVFLFEKISAEEVIIPKSQPKNLNSTKKAIPLPEKKPKIDEISIKKFQAEKFLLPKKKPYKKEKKTVEVIVEEKKEIKKVEIVESPILPKKKPVVYKKQEEKI